MSDKDNLVLVLLYAKWCGHCRNFYKKDSNGVPLELKDLKPEDGMSWQQVKKECGIKTMQFEEEELEKGGMVEGVDVGELNKYMKGEGRGWPTIIMLKKVGDKYSIFKQFQGDRSSMKNFKDFIHECSSEDKTKQKGGSIDYRHKYKKYKIMYRNLESKYKKINQSI
jgi:thiol-disulfide isomerase/thioredoxin